MVRPANSFPSAGRRQAAARVLQRRKKEQRGLPQKSLERSNTVVAHTKPWNDRFTVEAYGLQSALTGNTVDPRVRQNSNKKQPKKDTSIDIPKAKGVDTIKAEASYTERADGSPIVTVYRKQAQTPGSTSNMITRPCSPIDMDQVSKALEEVKTSETKFHSKGPEDCIEAKNYDSKPMGGKSTGSNDVYEEQVDMVKMHLLQTMHQLYREETFTLSMPTHVEW